MGDVEVLMTGQRVKESCPDCSGRPGHLGHGRVPEHRSVLLGCPQQSEHPGAAAELLGSLSSCIQIGR